jgi:acyl carrier protein
MDDVRSQVLAVVAQTGSLDPGRLTDEVTLRDLGLTSLDLVEIVFALEERFAIAFPYDDPTMEGRPLSELVATVQRLVQEKAAQATE